MPYTLQEEICQRMREGASPGELVEIPDIYKGLVMGKGGDNLREISTLTGAKVIRKGGEVYVTGGTREQREQAKVHIKIKIVSRSITCISLNYLEELHSQRWLLFMYFFLLFIDSLFLCIHTQITCLMHNRAITLLHLE